MNFKNQFITHGKIDFADLAVIKKNGSECDMIDFSIIENTIIESAINKSNRNKIAIGEIAIRKFTSFKLLKIDFFHTISDVVVFNIKKIVRHPVF